MKIYQNKMPVNECWDLGLSDTTYFVTVPDSTGRNIIRNESYKKALTHKKRIMDRRVSILTSKIILMSNHLNDGIGDPCAAQVSAKLAP